MCARQGSRAKYELRYLTARQLIILAPAELLFIMHVCFVQLPAIFPGDTHRCDNGPVPV